MVGTAIVTTEMLEGLSSAVTDNVAVILPVALTIMGVFVAISVIPKIIYRFL
ncbi:MAG: hypothetical protein GXY86_08150 [Firmicutes bacterium]|jgi:hypothetical protein|nr:hypothetical protein [Bacillota bacterium]